MKRKLAGMILLYCSLAFVLGADSISYNPGQPMPNPKGAPKMIMANGTYTLDTGHTLSAVTFAAESGGLVTSWGTSAGSGIWDRPQVGLSAGTYKCTAQLTVNDGQKIWLSKEAVANNVIVK